MWRFLCAVTVVCALTGPVAAQEITGSGSTFCYPLIAEWIQIYEKTSGTHIIYQPVGSSAGITEIRSETVDFAVSEAPLDDAQLLRDGLAQFPLVIGGIVPVVNIEGIGPGQFRTTGAILADIYLGHITKWNDAAIAALNPGLQLPNLAIQVMHRSDGSGTTFVWADYLAKMSKEWKARVGVHTTLAWPTGFGGKGNAGVAEKVARVRGAIGYIDYTYALRGQLTYVTVQNSAGNFITPDRASFEAATAGVEWMSERDFDVLLTDAPAANAYPIMATSFVLVRRYPKDPPHAHALLDFLRWVLEHGQGFATAQHYVPLPAALVEQVEGYWEAQKR